MEKSGVSVVVPLLNERESLSALHAEIKESLAPLGLSHEIIYVDDGSTDGSFEVIEDFSKGDPSTRGVRLRGELRQGGRPPRGIR